MRSFKTLTTFFVIAFLFAGCCKTEEISNRDSDSEVPQTEPYTFYVRNLNEVRQNGKRVEDSRLFVVGYEKQELWENIQTVWTNSYFLDRDKMYLKAKAKYEDIESAKFVEEVVYAEMYLVKEYEQGSIFKFAVEPLGALTGERLNTYFYVTDDKIYRLFSYVYQDDEVLTFYDNDELLTEVLDTDEKVINNAQIVCQNEEMKRELKEGDSEFHFSILKSENQISYSSCVITPNGEIYYYESFVWEEGKGLIEFNSGYRAEREPLYLSEISEISKERYRLLVSAKKDPFWKNIFERVDEILAGLK